SAAYPWARTPPGCRRAAPAVPGPLLALRPSRTAPLRMGRYPRSAAAAHIHRLHTAPRLSRSAARSPAHAARSPSAAPSLRASTLPSPPDAIRIRASQITVRAPALITTLGPVIWIIAPCPFEIVIPMVLIMIMAPVVLLSMMPPVGPGTSLI